MVRLYALAPLLIWQAFECSSGVRPTAYADFAASKWVARKAEYKVRSSGGAPPTAEPLSAKLPHLVVHTLVARHPAIAYPMAALNMTVADLIPLSLEQHVASLIRVEPTLDKEPLDAQLVLEGVISSLIPLVLFACCFKRRVTEPRPKVSKPYVISMRTPPHDFHKGLCECHCSFGDFLYALLCPCVRHADTLATAGLMGFWTVFSIFMAVEFLDVGVFLASLYMDFTYPESTLATVRSLLIAIIFVHKRWALRAKLGSPHPRVIFYDLLSWFFCVPCTVAQEGREVDLVSGSEVKCCCTYTTLTAEEVVGKASKANV